MDVTQQIVPMSKQLQRRPDYADSLEPGYRFCTINSELIVNYLKQKIETGKSPKSRLYEVNNIYDHNPKELADRLRACEDKWYFLTPREQTYPSVKQPSRKNKEGSWRTTQKYSTVYDDTIRGRVAVGRKRSLAYYDVNEEKTEWLMHEYTTNDPDLAIGTKGRNKLSDWVLCTLYKEEKNRVDNNTDHAQQVQNTRNGEQNNRNDDETSPVRRRLSVNQESNIQPKDQDIQVQDTKDHKSVLTDAMCSISSLIIIIVVALYWPTLVS